MFIFASFTCIFVFLITFKNHGEVMVRLNILFITKEIKSWTFHWIIESFYKLIFLFKKRRNRLR